MTIPWGTPPEPPKYEPPQGYKLVKIRPFYQRAMFWVPVVAVLAIVGMAASLGAAKNSTADTAAPVSPSKSSAVSSSPSASAPAVTSAPADSDTPVKTTSTPAVPASTKGAIGKPATVEWSGDDTGAVTVYSAQWAKPSADDIATTKNGAFLVIDVGYVGGTGTVSYNPLFWSLRDVDGREYDVSLMPLASYSPQLQSGDLAPGAKARGFLAFDVPRGPLTLELSGIFKGAVMTWSMPAK